MTLDEPKIINRQWHDDDERFKMLRLHGGQSTPSGQHPPPEQILFRPGTEEVYILDAVYAYHLYSGEALTTPPSFLLDNGQWTQFVGAWSALADYEVGDAVTDGGVYYVNLVAGNQPDAPAIAPTIWRPVGILTSVSGGAVADRAIRRLAVVQNNEVITHDKPLRLTRTIAAVPATTVANLDLHFIIRLLRLRP